MMLCLPRSRETELFLGLPAWQQVPGVCTCSEESAPPYSLALFTLLVLLLSQHQLNKQQDGPLFKLLPSAGITSCQSTCWDLSQLYS